jgi:circadian clock protein KaiC
VYPALVAAEHRGRFIAHQVPSGIPALDSLLGGGLDEGTSTLLMGPSGIGKSSVAAQYACAAALRGDVALFLMFDERLETLFARAAGLGMDLKGQVDAGRIELRPIASAELSLGQFVHGIRTAVEQRNARIIVIDSLSGYLAAMPGETSLMLQLHELLAYVGQKGGHNVADLWTKGALHGCAINRRSGYKLPHGQRAFVPLLRAQWRGTPGPFGVQATWRTARAHHSRSALRAERDRGRTAIAGVFAGS